MSAPLPAYLVAELAASDVEVAVSGAGGDELFGGRAREVFSPELRTELTGRRSRFCCDP